MSCGVNRMLCKELINTLLSTSYIDLDEALDRYGISHLEFRTQAHKLGVENIPVTEGLRLEVRNMTRAEISRKYRMTIAEVDSLLYKDIKSSQAQYLRKQGVSELIIYQETGEYDTDRLAKELQEKRDNGARVIDLADEYQMSHSRVSQLTNSSRRYKRLTQEERAAIKQSQLSPQQLAKQYDIGLNTVYVIKREP